MKLHAVNVLFCIKNPKKRPMSIKSLIYINYCLLLHKNYIVLTLPTLLLNYSLPSHAFEELPSSSALLKFHSHSGKFTRSWKNSTPTVENLPKVGKIPLPRWKIENQTNIVWTTCLPLILFFLYSVIKKMFFRQPP